MDALGASAPEPDDTHLFEAITASLNIDTAAIEQDATTPEATPRGTAEEPPTTPPAAAVPKPPAAPPTTSAPEAEPQRQAVPDAAPAPATIPARSAPVSVIPLPQPTPRPAKPERPALVEPTEPEPPDLGRAEKTGHYASVAGYGLSVGVGAFGQIMFLGTWLGSVLPAPGNWIAAAIGAAFAEIGMIGAGNSSLAKRKNRGRWKLLFAVACFVCFGAVVMQVTHWLPVGFGVALVFGLASFVGFLIHMVIEHSRIRDYEDRRAEFKQDQAAYQAEKEARYRQDLAAYNATIAEQQSREQADNARAARAAASSAEHSPERPRITSAPSPRPAAPKPKKVPSQRVLDEETAYAWSKAHNHPGPTAVRDHFAEAGYETPRSLSTLRSWINGRRDKEEGTA